MGRDKRSEKMVERRWSYDGDRVGISHRQSMWPFQYRFGASVTEEVKETFRQREDRGIHHAYSVPEGQGKRP
jgi:hypothetical protein